MIVFAGPSVSGISLSDYSEISISPPCRQGDVYLAAQDKPSAIGIVDGYFEGVPSVWHKEILWAMSRGIAVLGSSSMGALRAAELDAFGMIGIGEIYENYRNGGYEDDDEVALLHGPEELNYPQLSLAMVNVRATVEAALVENVVSSDQARGILDRAKACFYKHRQWKAIVGPDDEALLSWFESNTVDQKQRDAVALLEIMQSQRFETSGTNEFEFEITNFWHRNTKTWRQRNLAVSEDKNTGSYSLFGKEDL